MSGARVFSDRREAGRALAERLELFRVERPVVLALPRGGVPVAAEVARALDAPLDVVVVRKLGVPFQPELGMGAVGEGGARVVNREIVRAAEVSGSQLAAIETRERAEVARRARRYRGDHEMTPLERRVVILVDDGIATGATVHAAIEIVRAQGAGRVVVAVPVAPPEAVAELRAVADDVVVLEMPEPFLGVGRWYDDFAQTSDDEVSRTLHSAAARSAPDDGHGSAECRRHDVDVRVGPLGLAGRLAIPAQSRGLVVFAHGSGSSRLSPRNVAVSAVLQRARLATLLFDLLTDDEAALRRNIFDIELLAARLVGATAWCRSVAALAGLPVGYFGASTGAAAALWAAAGDPAIGAVVSRGGRPDLAGRRLGSVRAPTLLIVGGDDPEVLALNEAAAAALPYEHRIAVVPHAGHLFAEPGTLEVAAVLATDWLVHHLTRTAAER
jgi:putative phosphoribosyl transferase